MFLNIILQEAEGRDSGERVCRSSCCPLSQKLSQTPMRQWGVTGVLRTQPHAEAFAFAELLSFSPQEVKS